MSSNRSSKSTEDKDSTIKSKETKQTKETKETKQIENNSSSPSSTRSIIQDKDELSAFLLRAKLSDMKFTIIWNNMREIGWRYNGSEYITPNGMNIGTSRVAMNVLDTFALPFLTIRENSNDNEDSASNEFLADKGSQDLQKFKEVRTDLLKKIFSNLDPASRRFEAVESDDDHIDTGEDNGVDIDGDMGENDTHIIASQMEPNVKRKRDDQNQTARKFKVSATMNEPGTDRYFGGRRSRRIAKNQSIIKFTNKNATDDDRIETKVNDGQHKDNKPDDRNLESGQPPKLIWPGPIENVEAMKAMRTAEMKDAMRKPSYQYLSKHTSEWEFLLSTNHCLCFHGFGSKRFLMSQFAKSLRCYGDILTLDGHDPDFNISSLLDAIVALFLDNVEPSSCDILSQVIAATDSNIATRASVIAKTLGAKRKQPIFVLINNMDGVKIRNDDVQNCLAALIYNSHVNDGVNHCNNEVHHNERVIRLVASVDNVDACTFLSNKFAWIWKRTDTYYPYDEEIKMTISNETKKNKSLSKKEATNYIFMEKVLESIAIKHTSALLRLCELQLSKSGQGVKCSNEKYDFVDFSEWKAKCFESLVINNESELRKVMTELIDHKVIELRTDRTAGKDHLFIPTTRNKLREMLRKMKAEEARK